MITVLFCIFVLRIIFYVVFFSPFSVAMYVCTYDLQVNHTVLGPLVKVRVISLLKKQSYDEKLHHPAVFFTSKDALE